MYFLNLPVFCFIFFFIFIFDAWFMEASGWCLMYSNRETPHGLCLVFQEHDVMFPTKPIGQDILSKLDERYLSKYAGLLYFMWLIPVHSWFRQLEPGCYSSASQISCSSRSCLLHTFLVNRASSLLPQKNIIESLIKSNKVCKSRVSLLSASTRGVASRSKQRDLSPWLKSHYFVLQQVSWM